jgi:phospholipid/cholesterol/gamma-HCH transport system substrate-binding protein
METRAPYTLIGLFVLAVIVAVFGFIYWMNEQGGLGKKTSYDVRFQNSVSGLLTGSGVLFNGMRVGEVTRIALDPANPQGVNATIAVDSGTPIRADTRVGLEFQGLTGVPVVSLIGGSTDAAMPAAPREGGLPLLIADPNSGVSMTEAARDALGRLTKILADNAEPLRTTIANISTFAEALGRNSSKVDGIVAGLEKFTGGAAATIPPTVYDLTVPASFPQPAKTSDSQLIVADPTAIVALDTQKILVRPNLADSATPNAQWADSVPKLLQAKIVQALENANFLKAVAPPTDGFTANFQLLLDVRDFTISPPPDQKAVVEFSAKLMGEDGSVVASKIFRATAPAEKLDAAGASAALDKAFGFALTDLVAWTAESI